MQPGSPAAAKASAAHRSPKERGGIGRLVGWILVGTGAAFLTSGIVFGALARGKANELEDANASGRVEYADMRDVEDQGKAFEATQIATLTLGGAALVGGLSCSRWTIWAQARRQTSALGSLPA
jgi:hypothetical protein